MGFEFNIDDEGLLIPNTSDIIKSEVRTPEENSSSTKNVTAVSPSSAVTSSPPKNLEHLKPYSEQDPNLEPVKTDPNNKVYGQRTVWLNGEPVPEIYEINPVGYKDHFKRLGIAAFESEYVPLRDIGEEGTPLEEGEEGKLLAGEERYIGMSIMSVALLKSANKAAQEGNFSKMKPILEQVVGKPEQHKEVDAPVTETAHAILLRTILDQSKITLTPKEENSLISTKEYEDAEFEELQNEFADIDTKGFND